MTITREGDRLTIAIPYSKGDPNVACGTKLAKVRCTEAGALDLVRALASALRREDIVRIAFKEPATEPTPTA